jgi:hypothetical protein
VSFQSSIEATGFREVDEVLERIPRSLVPAARGVMARSGANLLQAHFSAKNLQPNRNGWPKTHFYAQAARGVQGRVEGEDIFIDATAPVGLRQRRYGGTITPKRVKYLTMPAAPEAYGKRAREFSNLKFAIVEDAQGRKRKALVQAESTLLSFGRKRKDGSRRIKVVGQTGGGVMYWLIRSATQAADPTVLPTREVIVTRVVRDTEQWLAAQLNPEGNP